MESIVTLAGKFKSHVELQQYCDSQFRLLEKAKKKLVEQEAEIKHLKDLLASAVPVVGTNKVEKILVSSEQYICENQIARIQEVALERTLEKDEVQKLEILVKTLYLIKGATAQPIDAQSAKLGELSIQDLEQIALMPEQEQPNGNG